MNVTIKRAGTILILATGVSLLIDSRGCREEGRHLIKEPAVPDVIGVYRFRASFFGDDIDGQIKKRQDTMQIELLPDGTSVVKDIPVILVSSDGSFKLEGFKTTRQIWSISAMGAIPRSSKEADAFYGIYLGSDNFTDKMNAPLLKTYTGQLELTFSFFNGDFLDRLVLRRTGIPNTKP